MKIQVTILMAAIWCSFQSANAQTYSVDWFKVSGGGGSGAVTNGSIVYNLSGTIGQQDAGGPRTAGNYTLEGGFWAIYAVQGPGAPTLSITLSNNAAVVSWPSPSTGFALQSNTNLNKNNWITPPQTVIDTGTIRYIIVTTPTNQNFYRLVNP